MKNKIKALEEKINLYDYHYRVLDNPLVSDQEFDRQMNELKKISKENPQFITLNSPLNKIGVALIDGFKKANHKLKMGSIDNVYTIEELKKWTSQFNKNTRYKLEDKYDGISGSLNYEEMKLMQAITRGNGDVGDDITENAKMCINVPSVIEEDIDEIRGEFVIFKKDFERINSTLDEEDKYSNPRNLTSGTMKSTNSQIVRDRIVHFIPFQAFKNKLEVKYDFHQFYHISWVKNQLSFEGNIDEIIEQIKKIEESKSYKNRPYMTDGLVVKICNLTEREELGYNSKSPKWAKAFKFKQETAQTPVEDIVWQVGKKHITPVAILKPVNLEGSTISRATLHNISRYEELQITIGDVVEIEKAGFIIPHINRNITYENDKSSFKGILHVPEECPICDEPTIIEQKEAKFLVCPNPDCRGKKYVILSNFVKTLKIDGIGDVFVKNLIDKEYVKTPIDLFSLTLDQLCFVAGNKNAKKIKRNIEKAVVQELKTIIQSLGIHQVGKGTSERLANNVYTFERFLAINETEMLQIPDIGEETIKCIVEYRKQHEDSLKRVKETFIVPMKKECDSDVFKDQTFVITGKGTRGRAELTKLVKDNGGKVSGSVSKKVDILILGSLESEGFSSTKTKKADSLGIKILSEYYLYDKLGIVEETEESNSDIDDMF